MGAFGPQEGGGGEELGLDTELQACNPQLRIIGSPT